MVEEFVEDKRRRWPPPLRIQDYLGDRIMIRMG